MKAQWRHAAVLALLALAAACSKRYWAPERAHRDRAEAVAKFYALRVLSDQAGTPLAEGLSFDPDGPPVEYPIAFTFGGTPYVRYRLKYWGELRRGARLVHVLYFDPTRIEHWDREDAAGEFPAHFSIVVDIDSDEVVESVPPAPPPP